jgi:hypothetical protein
MSEPIQISAGFAAILNQLPRDSQAVVRYELMSDGLVWTDEYPRSQGLGNSEIGYLRILWRFRSSLIMGSPDDKWRTYWDEGQCLFPNWPGFDPARSDPKWRSHFAEYREKAMRGWEELDREYQSRQADEEETQKQTVR